MLPLAEIIFSNSRSYGVPRTPRVDGDVADHCDEVDRVPRLLKVQSSNGEDVDRSPKHEECPA